jgi:hypothetical protein
VPDPERDPTPGKAQDALEELLRTVAKPAGPGPDPDVALAFATGWHVGEALVGVDEAAASRVKQACAQVRADTAHLRKRLGAAEQNADELNAAIGALAGADPVTPALAAAMSDTLGGQLLATDFRLGKSFALGRDLAQLFTGTTHDARAFRTKLLAIHDTLHDRLSQLASVLPPNAAHSVRDSLNMWGAALSPAADDVPGLEHEHVVTQGERWRSLLSGEKAGKDNLELVDYVGVGEGMVAQIRTLAVRALSTMWIYLAVIVGLLVLGVIGIVVWQHTAGSAAGIASILTALGLTWKGVGGSLGRAIAKVEQPAWDAQVDRAIAYAVTRPLPDALIPATTQDTLLGGLRAWRASHARPSDQGRRAR